MPDLRVRRTLVKSPPELWAELSEVEGLERHLGEFGEIKITRAEPETTVAWEGENASGTVELEPTGWGTKVTIFAAVEGAEAAPEPAPEQVAVEPVPEIAEPEPQAPEPEPEASEPEPVPEPRRRGFFARWLFRERRGASESHPAHRLGDFPIEPEPQMPAWRAEADPNYVESEPGASAASGDEEFEFDFPSRRPEEPEAEAGAPEPIAPERAQEVLETALENLGQAHHRPFSRG